MADILRNSDRQITKEEFEELLCNDTWKKELFIDKYLSFIDLYETEEQVRQAPIFPYGSFNNPEIVENELKNCLLNEIDRIVEWTKEKSKTLKLEFDLDYDIGYTINSKTSVKENSNHLVLALRKDTENLTKFGFYISAFNVIKK